MATAAELIGKRARVDYATCAAKGRPLATAILLAVSDAAALTAAGCAGFGVWSFVNPGVNAAPYLALWPALFVFLLVYSTMGLYPAAGLGPVEELRRTVLATTLVCLAASAAIFLLKDIGLYSRGVFILFWLGSAVLVPLSRALVRWQCAARPWWGVPVVIIGAGETGRLVCSRLVEQPYLGLKPVAFLDDGDGRRGLPAGVPVAGPLSAAPALAASLHICHALVAMPGVKRHELMPVLEQMGAVFAHLIVIPDLFGMASLWVSTRDLGGVLGLEIRQNLLVPVNRWLKRGLDLALASLFGILSIPVLALAVLWIKRVSPGPAFYTQQRQGEAGRPIRVLKLRTMYPDAEMRLMAYLAENPDARHEWDRYFKLRNDPRLLPGIGHFLRRTSLDELPQFWNVLRGEMSLVGPRPFPEYHLDQFGAKFRELRSRVAPGITGLWQVSARSDGDLRVQEALDTYYIRNWSLWLDLHILARTLRAVLSRQGAY
jgi:Undecaprenyl-phosphate galactose phosphotransferase WbaP